MNTTAKWTIKDVITTVLLSALLVVMQFIVNMVCMANHFVSMTLSVGFSVFICAPVYFLMVQRVGKRGVSFNDTSRRHFSNNGKLVFIAVLHRYRLNMRSRFMETWGLSKSAPAYGCMDGFQPVI